MDDGVDEPNERDEDFDDESPLGPEGCLFPGECCMPGPHYESECHTPEMLMAQEVEAASAPNAEVSDTGRAETPTISGQSTNAPGVRLH